MKNNHTSTGPAAYAVDWLQQNPYEKKKEPYIKPSSLAKGCLLYVAFELQGKPKPPLDARIGRILSVGTDSHKRLQKMLERACLAQEVFWEAPEYRIHGYCDAILYIPPYLAKCEADVGFWVLEIKTAANAEFERVKTAATPKEEHIRQVQIYLWGLNTYFQGQIPLKGAVIYYENRDTLEHIAFEVYEDKNETADLFSRVHLLLEGLKDNRLPDDHLPPGHWAHQYCPYLEICEPGRQAMEMGRQQPSKD